MGCGSADSLERVRELHEEGRIQESLELLRELLEERPGDPEVQYRYGFALRRVGQPDDAIWALSASSSHEEWVLFASRELAAAGFESKNWPTAVDAAGRILELEPDDLEALALRGRALLEAGQHYEAALADLDRVLTSDPDDTDLRASRVQALLMLKRFDAVAEELERIEELGRALHLGDAEVSRLCATRAVFAKEQRRFEAAEAQFDKCLEEFPESTWVVTEMVAFLDERGELGRGTGLLREHLERRTGAVDMRVALANRLRAAGAPAEAERVLLEGAEVGSAAAAAAAWSALANHHMELGDAEAAAAALGESIALRAAPTPQQRLAYADLLATAGSYERAAEIAAELPPPFGDIVWARIRLTQRQPAEALTHFDNALRLWPNNGAARYYAAQAAERVGDFDRAIEEYRQAIRSGAATSDAGLALARLHEAEGAYAPALVAVGHHLSAYPHDSDARVLAVRVSDLAGDAAQRSRYLEEIRDRETWARAMAALALHSAEARGPAAAIEGLRSHKELVLTEPDYAPALRTLVSLLVQAERMPEAATAVSSALAAHPEAAVFHELAGMLLELEGVPPERVRAAYRRALEVDPENARALGGLAAQADDVDSALAWYDRAIAADPEALAARRGAAKLLAEAGRTELFEQHLEDLLWVHPYDTEAALALAALDLDRGRERVRARELAARAARFGRAAEAQALLARIDSGA
jgi:tetratricopeptide (TPR) repeat protein